MSAYDPISTDTADSRVLTLYYDGSCPLCAAEMLWLRAGNQRRLLAFVDVAADDYQPACHGLSCERALAALHGRFDDGELLVGVPVFAAAYARAGHPVLAALYRQPLLQPFPRASQGGGTIAPQTDSPSSPVSSPTSRTAAPSGTSPASRCPFGNPQLR